MHQIEFPLSVAICAWCRPRECGNSLGEISHGICPKHLRKIKMQLLRQADAQRTRSDRQGQAPGNEACLYPRF